MASPVLSPPPLTSPLAQKDGTPSPTWGRWLQLLQSILSGMAPPGTWQTPTLNVGWTNLGGFTLRYRKDAVGVVWVDGVVVSAGTGNVFTLPVGFRPGQEFDVPFSYNDGTEKVGRLKVSATGVVQVTVGVPSTFGAIHCSFPADG